MTAIQKACEICGSQRELARRLGVTPATINQWIFGERPVPIDRCPAIERITDGKVLCGDLRDDVQWVRIPDTSWPHPDGRPLVDHSPQVGAVGRFQTSNDATYAGRG